MRKKKFISLLLTIIMALGICPIAFAEELPEELKAVIISVKEKIDIPEEYSEFEYNLDDFDGFKSYSLEWSKPQDEKAGEKVFYVEKSIRVEADTKGRIISFNNMGDGYENGTISSQKTKEECIKAAEAFIKKVMPDTYSEYKYEKNEYGYAFVFRRYKNDVPVSFNDILIFVDSQNLNVVNFRMQNPRYFDGVFDKKDGIISEDEAVKLYIDETLYNPEYQFNYDFITKEKKVFLAYGKHNLNNMAIDAKTGDLIDLSPEYGYATTEASGAASDNAKYMEEDGGRLSEQEIQKTEDAKGLISKETALAEIKKAVPENIKFENEKYSGLSKDIIEDDEYRWTFNFENGFASINAKTKEIISFYSYEDYEQDEKSEKTVSEERKAEAAKWIEKLAPDKADKVELSEKYSENNDLSFIRKVNGYSFPDNNISMVFDNKGNLVSYMCTWNKSIEFPNPEKVIDKNEAFDKIRKSGEFGLQYNISSANQTNNIVLTYYFNSLENTPVFIDAETGKGLRYDGSEDEGVNKAPESYPDIAGHWCEKFVNSLKENDIYVKRELFLPDEKITKDGFLKYYTTGLPDNIRKEYTDNGDFITRREMCSVVSYVLGYEKLVDKNVFKNVFADVEETDEKFGDMAAANAMGVLTADGSGNFYPDREITNAEAAKIIYTLEDLRYS